MEEVKNRKHRGLQRVRTGGVFVRVRGAKPGLPGVHAGRKQDWEKGSTRGENGIEKGGGGAGRELGRR